MSTESGFSLAMENKDAPNPHLNRTLGPFMLWGLGVGYVISGMYFGWNLGLPAGGTIGLAIATLFITIMYVSFTLGYCELASAIPRAGGAFDYATRALGPAWGFLGGLAQIIEFVFAPPAISAAIGAYLQKFFPDLPVLPVAILAYLVFTWLNIRGVRTAATFELWITIAAVAELLLFAMITLPHFRLENLTRNALPNGAAGIFASVPFAIWFFLAIECVANVAEETVNPQRNVVIGFCSAMATLVALCALTFLGAVGVAGWEAVVFETPGAMPSDSPLPLALGHIVTRGHLFYHLLVTVGLFGLIASFHGIILAAGRASFEFGRVGYVWRRLGTVHPRYQTPAIALIVNMGIGILALMTGKTAEIITLAGFGAVTLYIVSMISLFVLRRREPLLPRPFKTPLYPVLPAIALVLASASLVAMMVYNFTLSLIYFGMLGTALVWFKLGRSKRGIVPLNAWEIS